MKKISYVLLVSALMLASAPSFAADGTYIFNFDGPSGVPAVDSGYNFGKDISWTILRFAFLPVEIITKFIVNAI